MEKVITDEKLKAGIDKRVMAYLEPRIGVMGYNIIRSLLTGYIKTLLTWAKDNEYRIE